MNIPRWGGQWLFPLLLLALCDTGPVRAQSPNDAGFLSAVGELRDATYSEKANIAERLGQGGHRSVRAVLTALMEDRLYFRNNDQKVFIAKSAESDPLDLIDPLSLKAAGSATADSLTKIGTNNALRRTLRTTVAHFGLSSPDAAVRLEAVRDMLRSLDDSTVALLRKQLAVETNSRVRKEIATGLALATLDGSDNKARLEAIATLSQSVSQDVRNRVALLFDKSPDGAFVENDAEVRRAAATAVAAIDQWRKFYSGIETLFFGLSLGSVLVLIAIGLAITFGVMGVINMAQAS
jgi:urea transport system permease protein